MNFPAERLFWLVVEAPGIRRGALPAGLWSALEDDLPVNPELVWAVGAPIDGQRLLVCAALKSDLAEIVADDGVLTPDHVPESIIVGHDDARVQLNLLVGSFEPVPLRNARRRRHLLTAVAALFSAALAGIGLERRAAVWDRESRDLDAAGRSVVASVSPSLGWSRDDLAMELRQRKEAAPAVLNVPGDAALALAALIARWPVHIPAKPQSIASSGNSASFSVLIPPPGDAAMFLAALKVPEGWSLEEPRLVSLDEATRINLELRRSTP